MSIGFEKNTNCFDRYLQEFSFFLQIPRHTCGGWVPTAIADAAAKPTADADAQRGHTADDACQRLVCVSDCVGVGPATPAVRCTPASTILASTDPLYRRTCTEPIRHERNIGFPQVISRPTQQRCTH